MFNLNEIYQKSISDLKNYERARVHIDQKLKKSLLDFWPRASEQDKNKILFLFIHSIQFFPEMESFLCQQLKSKTNDEFKIQVLAAIRKHAIDGHFRQGLRVSSSLLQNLDQLLTNSSASLQEWILRTIEATGGQSIFFKQKILAIKPKFWKIIFSRQLRTNLEIIIFLERSWQRNL